MVVRIRVLKFRKSLHSIQKELNSRSQVANWRMEKLEVDSKSGSDEEFFDCIGEFWIMAFRRDRKLWRKLILNFVFF